MANIYEPSFITSGITVNSTATNSYTYPTTISTSSTYPITVTSVQNAVTYNTFTYGGITSTSGYFTVPNNLTISGTIVIGSRTLEDMELDSLKEYLLSMLDIGTDESYHRAQEIVEELNHRGAL